MSMVVAPVPAISVNGAIVPTASGARLGGRFTVTVTLRVMVSPLCISSPLS